MISLSLPLENDLSDMAAKADIRKTVEDALWEAGIDLSNEEIIQLIDDYVAGDLDGKNFARSIKTLTGVTIKDLDTAMDATFPAGEDLTSGYYADTDTVIEALSKEFDVPTGILLGELGSNVGDTIDANEVYNIIKALGFEQQMSYTDIQALLDKLQRDASTIKSPF